MSIMQEALRMPPMTRRDVQLSIIVPTFREAENLGPLMQRVFDAVDRAGLAAEMIIVDDNSQDGSAAIVEAARAEHDVRIVVREQERGLSTAVLRGFQEARGPVLLVMDADLSHPPEKIPDLYRAVAEGGADFAIGSRYVEEGQTRNWPWLRKLNSLGATVLARPLTAARDPMAGFFCLPRRVWETADELSPLGYKIGLELLVKGRCRSLKEIPIEFADRHAGQSKLNARQQWLYLRHLWRLYGYRYPTACRVVQFAGPVSLAVGIGLAIHWWLD